MRVTLPLVLVLALAQVALDAAPGAAEGTVRRRPARPAGVVVKERPADDTVEVHINRLGYGFVEPEDGEAQAVRPEAAPIKEYEGDFRGLNMFGSNGLIETTAPHTLGANHLQVGFNFIDRRLGNDANRITARASFQHLNFGILDRLDAGFGSTGYYKSASNTTYYNAKLRLTNPKRHRFSAAVGVRTLDFGTATTKNTTNYYGALGFPMRYSELFLNAFNNAKDNWGDLTFSGGLLFTTDWSDFKYPVALMIEGLQDANNSFNKYNFGVRWAFTENAMIDLIMVRDVNRDEFSPAVGGTLTF